MRPRLTTLKDMRGVLLLLVGMLALGGGAAIAAIGGDQANTPQSDDEGLQWESLATGVDRNFGRFELYRASAGARECIGVSLPDQDPVGVKQAIAGSCVDDPALRVSLIRGRSGTFAAGVTTDEATTVTLRGEGRPAEAGRIVGSRGSRKYFVASSGLRLTRPEVRASDAQGRTIGAHQSPE
jgi:hypothetical protein